MDLKMKIHNQLQVKILIIFAKILRMLIQKELENGHKKSIISSLKA